MTIIEADGQYTEPLDVDSIQIYAAQRYSFVVRCPSLSRRDQNYQLSLFSIISSWKLTRLWETTGFVPIP